MHEEAVLRDLVRKVNELALSEPTGRVKRVRLWVGALSHLRPEDLTQSWSRVAAGTRAEPAVVEAESSSDVHDPRAQGVVLVGVEMSGDDESPGGSATS
ncbi:MAG TPA: hydrogenase/urease maturation nickel metallochaperone HypA [Thermoplasmata archaeon]|nr:hydrogenase/urease maturation nickel metallochaperone HypA [Thermoplasmata archaeon]